MERGRREEGNVVNLTSNNFSLSDPSL